jgi:polyisoprenoid-binding protein YceI
MNTILSTEHPHDQLAGTHWRLDPSGSVAEFRVRGMWGLTNVRGEFTRLDGRLDSDEDGDLRVELKIDAASLQTGNRKRDKHLRSPEFFDVGRHSEVSFRSTAVEDLGDGRLRVDGELEAAGRRLRLELQPTIRQTEDQLQIEVETTVDRRQLGMTSSPLGMKTPAKLVVRARLRRFAS